MPVATKRQTDSGDARSIARELSADNKPDNPLVEHLERQVANAFVLYTNFKHYHWQTYGPLFRDLHKLFDEFAGEVLDSLDELAERLRMIGQNPPANLTQIVELASVVSGTGPDSTMREMVEEADRNALVMIKEIRDGVKLAEEHEDPGTVDLLSKVVQIHEKHEWYLRDILRKPDGLTS